MKIRLKSFFVKIKEKNRKRKRFEIKSLMIVVIGLLLIESYLWILESNNQLDEPYLWGNRNIVAFKTNECRALFSRDENKDKTKIVIIGDSIALHGINPILLDEFINDNTITYNFAVMGTSIKFQSLLIEKVILPKLKPDFIIWSIYSPADLSYDENLIASEKNIFNSSMARYYSDDLNGCDFDEILDYFLLKVSRIYKYRLSILPFFSYENEEINEELEKFKDDYDNGFQPLYGTYDGDDANNGTVLEIVGNIQYKYNKQNAQLFLDTIDEIKKNNLNYLIVSCPHRCVKMVHPEADDICNNLDQKHFLNLNGEPVFANNSIYVNFIYTNNLGSQIFTLYVYEKLRTLL